MKRRLYIGVASLVLFGAVQASATLTTIGTATYSGSDYNLVWDDDNSGNSVIWLDYSNAPANWSSQKSWAAGLGNNLIYNIDIGYNVTWDDDDWRLECSGYGVQDEILWINDSEIFDLAYDELGLSVWQRYENFNNLRDDFWYWSGTKMYNGNILMFQLNGSYGSSYPYNGDVYGIALRSGRVSTDPVPEPATILLFCTGLVGLIGAKIRKKRSRA